MLVTKPTVVAFIAMLADNAGEVECPCDVGLHLYDVVSHVCTHNRGAHVWSLHESWSVQTWRIQPGTPFDQRRY